MRRRTGCSNNCTEHVADMSYKTIQAVTVEDTLHELHTKYLSLLEAYTENLSLLEAYTKDLSLFEAYLSLLEAYTYQLFLTGQSCEGTLDFKVP